MSDDNKMMEAPVPDLDERAISKKYGLRELNYPDTNQNKALSVFLTNAIDTGRCGPLPKTAVVVLLDFLQATINRQHITKGPRMTQEEFDAIQAPYYLAARIVAKIQRSRQEASKGKVYQATYVSLTQFIELLRNLLDPGCYWIRIGSVPEGMRESMEALRDFLTFYPEQRRKSRE